MLYFLLKVHWKWRQYVNYFDLHKNDLLIGIFFLFKLGKKWRHLPFGQGPYKGPWDTQKIPVTKCILQVTHKRPFRVNCKLCILLSCCFLKQNDTLIKNHPVNKSEIHKLLICANLLKYWNAWAPPPPLPLRTQTQRKTKCHFQFYCNLS